MPLAHNWQFSSRNITNWFDRTRPKHVSIRPKNNSQDRCLGTDWCSRAEIRNLPREQSKHTPSTDATYFEHGRNIPRARSKHTSKQKQFISSEHSKCYYL